MMLSPSPHLQRQPNFFREDSSVEPVAFRATRWPPTHPALKPPLPLSPTKSFSSRGSYSTSPPLLFPRKPHTQSLNPPRKCITPPRKFPRSYTAPAKSFKPSTLSFNHHPVQLTPGLTPLMRDTLPQPKPVRPRPIPPQQSDLSAASTRAEHEPLAVRDLRRVTAPPSLMDPWDYPSISQRQDIRDIGGWGRVAKSSSFVTDRDRIDVIRRERYSVLEKSRWALPQLRLSDRKHTRKKRFHRDPFRPSHIPDRLHDSFSSRAYDEELDMPSKDHSVTSGLTNDSDGADDVEGGRDGFRQRSISESVVKRKSSLLKGGKSVWEKLWRRRKDGPANTEVPDARNSRGEKARSSRGMGEMRRSGRLYRRIWMSESWFGSKRVG